MNIKGAIFDFDGTLVESMGIWEKIDRIFLASKGHEVPKDFGRTIAFMTFMEVAEYTVDLLDLKETPQQLYDEWMAVAIDHYQREVVIKDNVRQGLEYLRQKGIRMAIASASDTVIIESYLKWNKLDEYIDAVVTTTDVKASKNSPQVYVEAARQLGFEHGECAVFEDILRGIQSAKEAGFKTVAVYDRYSEHEHEAMCFEADVFIEDFGMLPDVIE